MGWLYAGADRRIPEPVRELLEAEEPLVSPIIELELTYLYEVGRVSEPASAPLSALARSIGLRVSDVSCADLARTATGLSWTRDPFDRMIAAHAIVENAQLVTADRTIRKHLSLAAWD